MYNGFIIKLQKEMISMKILIWLLCAFVPSAIQTVCKQGGYPLGAVEALILYAPAYWAAFKLCKVYDERKAAKEAAAVAESPATEELPAPQPEQEPTIADPSSPAPATPKLRFCKHCGSPIDPATRQCTGCGKQYFRPPVLHKKHLAIAAAALACVAIVFLVSNLIAQKNSAQAQVDALNARITELESTVAEKERQIEVYKRNEDAYQVKLTRKSEEYDKLRKENTMYREHLRYCEYYCAYIIPNGQIYHRLDCPYAGATEDLVILYIDFLESKGCKPCSHCYG